MKSELRVLFDGVHYELASVSIKDNKPHQVINDALYSKSLLGLLALIAGSINAVVFKKVVNYKDLDAS